MNITNLAVIGDKAHFIFHFACVDCFKNETRLLKNIFAYMGCH